jgi:ubiquinone/menaquinone biosynthesis C-methylase UbiE
MDTLPPDDVMAAQCRRPHGDLATTISASMSKGNAALILQTYQLPELAHDAQVLEVGIGNGQHFPTLFARIPHGHLTGVDYSAEMVSETQARHADRLQQGNLHVEEGTLGALPLAEHSMDAVFSINTLYFWDDPEACLQDLYRVIRPGGTLNLGIRTRAAMATIPFTRLGFQCYERDEAISLVESQQRFELARLEYTPDSQGQFAAMDALSLCFRRLP